jgi:hypothetical protein
MMTPPFACQDFTFSTTPAEARRNPPSPQLVSVEPVFGDGSVEHDVVSANAHTA